MQKNVANKAIKLSILVPAYNVEKYVAECLGSIMEQLTNECEVIVYNDASTDNTVETIKNSPIYQKSNFKFMQGDINKGLSYARNTLQKNSVGEYIWFMDSDDKILDGAIKKILNCIQTSSPDTIFFNYNIWHEAPTNRDIRKGLEEKSYAGPLGNHVTNGVKTFIHSLRSRNLHAPSKVYRRGLFSTDTEFPVGRIFEDINVTPLLASLSKNIYYLNEPLFAYRQRPGSIISSRKPEDEVEKLISSYDLRERYEKIHGTICEEALQVLTYFSASQLRGGIKSIIKNAPLQQQPQLLEKSLSIFQKIHKRNFYYIMRTCYREEGIALCFHVAKRIFQAHWIIRQS